MSGIGRRWKNVGKLVEKVDLKAHRAVSKRSKTKQIKQTQPKASKRSKVKQIKLIMNLNLYLIMILIVIVRGLRPLPAQQSKLASQKVQWADNVTMTNAEHQKLLDAHGPADTALMIEHLSHYKAANGKHYDSDYRAILAWVTKWLSEQKGTKTGAAQRPSKAPTPMPPTQESLAEQEQRILANERWMRDFLESQREDEQDE